MIRPPRFTVYPETCCLTDTGGSRNPCGFNNHDLLQSQYDIPSRYVAIPSNHWNILASRHLKYALEQHLFGWLIQPSQIVQADKPQKQRFYHYQQQQEQHKEQPNEHGNGITTSSLSSSSSSSSSFNNSSITPSSSSSDNNNRMKENRTMVPTTWTNQWFSWWQFPLRQEWKWSTFCSSSTEQIQINSHF